MKDILDDVCKNTDSKLIILYAEIGEENNVKVVYCHNKKKMTGPIITKNTNDQKRLNDYLNENQGGFLFEVLAQYGKKKGSRINKQSTLYSSGATKT